MKIAIGTIAAGIVLGLAASQTEAAPSNFRDVIHFSGIDQPLFYTGGPNGTDRAFMNFNGNYDLAHGTGLDRLGWFSTWEPYTETTTVTEPMSPSSIALHNGWVLRIHDVIGDITNTDPVSIEWSLSRVTPGEIGITPRQVTDLRLSRHTYWVNTPGTAALLGIGLLALWRARV